MSGRPFAGRAWPGTAVFAQPQSITSRRARCAVAFACLAMVIGVLIGEVATPEEVTFGGFSLLAVLLATWLVPVAYAAIVTVAALGLPVVAEQLHAIDPVTAKFQFAATAVAAVLSFLTVRAIQRSHAERQRSHERLLQFTANAAHELRSPLTLMRASLEHMVRRPRSQEEYEQQAATVLAEVDRLIRVSNALLTLARSDAGVLTLQREPVEAESLIGATARRWRSAAIAKGVTLRTNCSATGSVVCDAAMVGRVLDNLVENAIRHTPAGGSVVLRADPGPGGATLLLQVTDTGGGIDSELVPTLFQRFSTGVSRRRADGGTGLGLALSAAIAGAHGGSIRCAASSAGGTTMVVDLPVTRG